jgi:hypothetical protein
MNIEIKKNKKVEATITIKFDNDGDILYVLLFKTNRYYLRFKGSKRDQIDFDQFPKLSFQGPASERSQFISFIAKFLKEYEPQLKKQLKKVTNENEKAIYNEILTCK